MSEPNKIESKKFEDHRGAVIALNEFDLSTVMRCYFIENVNTDFVRGWQGHNIESRWFTVSSGAFNIYVIAIKSIKKKISTHVLEYHLSSDLQTVLHVPPGYVTAIKATMTGSRLQVFSDYSLGAVDDEIRFDINTFDPLQFA